MKSKTNLSIRNNQGVYVSPNIILGDNGNYASGDILDANAVVEKINSQSGQDVIPDLEDIRSGATAGSTALQPSDIVNLEHNVFVNTNSIGNISSVIPTQASDNNKLADKEFVNSSISTNTADFKGTYSLSIDLQNNLGNLTSAILADGYSAPNNNDYCFVIVEESNGNVKYKRYKFTKHGEESHWDYEFELNNSSYTADQWAAILSGITAEKVNKLDLLPNSSSLDNMFAGINYSLNRTVSSSDIGSIVVLSLAQYDALSEKNPTVEYNII